MYKKESEFGTVTEHGVQYELYKKYNNFDRLYWAWTKLEEDKSLSDTFYRMTKHATGTDHGAWAEHRLGTESEIKKGSVKCSFPFLIPIQIWL